MALMPMPPMPMMWKVPISRGICMVVVPSSLVPTPNAASFVARIWRQDPFAV